MDQAHKKDHFNLRAFGSDVLVYSFGQILLLIFGLIQSLIIPKYLPTADYGYWQLFLLYTAYVGILHFGFLDGILVRWAGREFKEIRPEVPAAFRFLLLEQFLIVGILGLVLVAINFPSLDVALAVLANGIIVNFLMFFTFTAQAVKQFKLVTAANISKGAIFLLLVLGLFFGGVFGYKYLYIATIVAGTVILILLIVYLRDSLFSQTTCTKSLWGYGKENISIGVFVLLSNFITILLMTIDRLTVGSFFTITQFAQYTFAISMCTIVVAFVSAVSQVFFPYLSESSPKTRIRAYQLLKPVVIIFWAGALVMYFPFTTWVNFYLPDYTPSLPIVAILLCMMGFSSQIQILHLNFFKAYHEQRLYFTLAGLSLVCAVVLYLLAAKLFGTLVSIAIMAVISSLLWYLFNEFSLHRFVSMDGNWKATVRWLLVIGTYAGAFLATCGLVQNWIYGTVIYLTIFILVTSTVLKPDVISLVNMVRAAMNQTGDINGLRTQK